MTPAFASFACINYNTPIPPTFKESSKFLSKSLKAKFMTAGIGGERSKSLSLSFRRDRASKIYDTFIPVELKMLRNPDMISLFTLDKDFSHIKSYKNALIEGWSKERIADVSNFAGFEWKNINRSRGKRDMFRKEIKQVKMDNAKHARFLFDNYFKGKPLYKIKFSGYYAVRTLIDNHKAIAVSSLIYGLTDELLVLMENYEEAQKKQERKRDKMKRVLKNLLLNYSLGCLGVLSYSFITTLIGGYMNDVINFGFYLYSMLMGALYVFRLGFTVFKFGKKLINSQKVHLKNN